MSRNLKFYNGDDPLYRMKLEGEWSEGKNPETKLHIKEEIMRKDDKEFWTNPDTGERIYLYREKNNKEKQMSKEQKPRANISTNPPVGDPPPGQGVYVGRPVGTEQGIGIGHAAGVRTSQERYQCLHVNEFKMTEIGAYYLVEIGCEKFITSTKMETIRIIRNKLFDYWDKVEKARREYYKAKGGEAK